MVKRIYNNAKDKDVAAVILYVNYDASSNKSTLYYDEDFQNEVFSEDFTDLFIQGVIFVDENGMYVRPVVYESLTGSIYVIGGQPSVVLRSRNEAQNDTEENLTESLDDGPREVANP